MSQEVWYKFIIFDDELQKDTIVMAKASNIHHAKNQLYEKGLVPIREATDEDYERIYGSKV